MAGLGLRKRPLPALSEALDNRAVADVLAWWSQA
jgi:hypothetical protein